MRPMPALLLVALTAAGCTAHAARDPATAMTTSVAAGSPAALNPALAGLDGSRWLFVELDGVPVPRGVKATLRMRDGRASGRAGCNTYGARYHITADGSAEFKQTLSTKMACLQPTGVMRVEQGVFNAFRRATHVTIASGDLVMLDAAGRPLARLQRQTP